MGKTHVLMQDFWLQLKYRFYTVAKQQAFLQDIAGLIEDGVSANQAIEMMCRVSKGLDAEVVNSVLTAIAAGHHFAEGMQGWFPPHIVAIIRAGEQAGSLTRAMHAAIASLQQHSTAMTSLLSSLPYPLIVVIMGFAVMVFINHSVFANFRDVLPLSRWPNNAKTLVNTADFVQGWWWFIALTVLVITVLIGYGLRAYIGRFRQYIDAMPIFSYYRQLNAARFMEMLGMLIGNGLVFKQALAILQQNTSPYLYSHLLAMEYRLGLGRDNIAEVLDTGLIQQTHIQRLQLIASGKNFEQSLVRLGKRAGQQCVNQMQRSGKIAGACVLFFAAGLAAFMIFAIYDVGSILGG